MFGIQIPTEKYFYWIGSRSGQSISLFSFWIPLSHCAWSAKLVTVLFVTTCLSVCPFVWLFVWIYCLSFVCLFESVCRSCLSVCRQFLTLFVCLCVSLFVWLLFCQYVCRQFLTLFVCLSICVFVYSFDCLSVSLFICSSVSLPCIFAFIVCLFVSIASLINCLWRHFTCCLSDFLYLFVCLCICLLLYAFCSSPQLFAAVVIVFWGTLSMYCDNIRPMVATHLRNYVFILMSINIVYIYRQSSVK